MINKIVDVSVTNYNELVAALQPFLPTSNTTIREELIKGFDIVKERSAAYEIAVATTTMANFGHHVPATIADPRYSRFWLDQFIERRMGGKRVGNFVQWQLGNETYTFEPYAGILKKG